MTNEAIVMRLGNDAAPARIVDETDGTVSPHTGRMLRHITIETVFCGEDEHEHAEECLVRDAKIDTTDAEGNTATSLVGKRSYSFTSGSSQYRYTVELDAYEELRVTQLDIDDLSVIPYHYEERAEKGGIVIDARARLDAKQYDRLLALLQSDIDYWPVVRRGISDEARQMRLGGMLRWSQEGDIVKHDILLIEKGHDEERPGRIGLLEPQTSYTRWTLASTTELLDGLLDLLGNKGVLTEMERTALRGATKERALERCREFFRVPDLDNIDP